MRRSNADYLTNNLRNVSGIQLQDPPRDFFHVYQMYSIRVKDGIYARDALKDHLAKKGIMSKIYFEPIHFTSFYKRKMRYYKGHLPFTEKLSEEILTIPMYPTLCNEEMDYLIQSITEFMK